MIKIRFGGVFLLATFQQWLISFVTPLINSVAIVLDFDFFRKDKLSLLMFTKNIVDYVLTWYDWIYYQKQDILYRKCDIYLNL